jgi:hypothetical protein
VWSREGRSVDLGMVVSLLTEYDDFCRDRLERDSVEKKSAWPTYLTWGIHSSQSLGRQISHYRTRVIHQCFTIHHGLSHGDCMLPRLFFCYD